MPALNIAAYLFVPIADPSAVAAAIQAACTSRGLLGSVLVAPEGLNLFLAGEEAKVDAVLNALRADPRFAALREKRSWSAAVPFRRLLVKVKPEIITFRQPGIDPVTRPAPTVAPTDLRRWIEQGHDDDGVPVALIDTRNDEELDYGGFVGALRLGIQQFTELPEALERHRDALAGKTLVTYCTGGVRCEKAAPWMLANGYERVVQLQGGILGYFEREGGAGYEGGCFVFDERISVNPDLSPASGVKRRFARGDGQRAGGARR